MSVIGVPESGSLLSLTESRAKDTSGRLSETDKDNAISTAITRYSRHRPLTKILDIAGSGTNDINVPAEWVPEFSELRSVEYPVGQVPAELLGADDFTVYKSPAGEKIRLLTQRPSAQETLRITITVLRTQESIPAVDLNSVADFAASLCLRTLASMYLDTSDPTIGADVVNYRSKSGEATSLANKLEEQYNKHIGIKDDGSPPAASAVSSFTVDYPGGSDRLTHPRRQRDKR